MTTIPRLGRRQVDVLRAAAKPYGLIRFADGGWQAGGKACTQPARSVAAIEPALLVEGKPGAVVTGGSWESRPGTWMGLSEAGQAALDAWELANAPAVIAHLQHTEAIRVLAAKPGPITGDDMLRLAANAPTLDDGAFTLIARATDGRPVVDEPPTT